jgi:hypothetical protein
MRPGSPPNVGAFFATHATARRTCSAMPSSPTSMTVANSGTT